MATKQTLQNIDETFVTGFGGIFKISRFRERFLKESITIFSIVIAIIFPIISIIGNIPIVDFIKDIDGLMINFLPGILGFTIAGYSLVIGFVQSNMLNSISEPSKDSKFSLYQLMSANFAFNIILQAIALVIAYGVHFINYIDEKTSLNLNVPESALSTFNLSALALLSFWFTISLFLVIQIIINIFGFSQLHHYFVNKSKIDPPTEENSSN